MSSDEVEATEAPTAKLEARYKSSKLEFASAVTARKNEVLVLHGFILKNPLGTPVLDEDGNEQGDYLEAKKVAATHVQAAVVHAKNERATVGLSQGDLYSKTFPQGPDPDDDSLVEATVCAELTRYVWGITQPKKGGYVQKRLDNGYMLARPRVFRSGDPVTVVFITDDAKLVMSDLIQPEIERLFVGAEDLHDIAELAVGRVPALSGRAAKAIEAGTKKAADIARINKSESDTEDED